MHPETSMFPAEWSPLAIPVAVTLATLLVVYVAYLLFCFVLYVIRQVLNPVGWLLLLLSYVVKVCLPPIFLAIMLYCFTLENKRTLDWLADLLDGIHVGLPAVFSQPQR